MIAALGRSLVMEAGLGTGHGHGAVRAWFETWLAGLPAKP